MFIEFLRCIFMPFSVIDELNEIRAEYMALYLLAIKRTPDHDIQELLLRDELTLTEDQLHEFLDHVERLTEEE